MGYEEEKRNRFIRIAEKRTNKILDDFRLLGNCSNKSNYAYNEEDIKKIFNTIEQDLKVIKAKFYTNDKSNKFKL